jgi:hypothetical protein
MGEKRSPGQHWACSVAVSPCPLQALHLPSVELPGVRVKKVFRQQRFEVVSVVPSSTQGSHLLVLGLQEAPCWQQRIWHATLAGVGGIVEQ